MDFPVGSVYPCMGSVPVGSVYDINVKRCDAKSDEHVPGIAMQPGLISRMSFLACVKLTLVSIGQWTVFIMSGWNGARAVR